MTSDAILLTALAVISAAVLVLFFFKLKQRQDEIQDLIDERFPPQDIVLRESYAFLFSQQSRGSSQRRGAGPLILTKDELFFAMPLPRVMISVPVRNIRGTERVSRMLGRGSLKRDVLKIHYLDEQGEEDSLGFKLKAKDLWESEIRRLQDAVRSRIPS